MQRVLRASVAALLVLGLSAGVAIAATTADQLVALARAGLDEDILIALIQTDGSVFQLTADDILELHRQGLSDRVILAMLQTAMRPAAENRIPDTPAAQEPQAVSSESAFKARPPAAVPPVARRVFRPFDAPMATGATVANDAPVTIDEPVVTEVLVPVAVPVPVPAHGHAPSHVQSSPVYWGWGGQRRPDSWDDGSPPARTAPARPAPARDTPAHETPARDSKDNGKKDR